MLAAIHLGCTAVMAGPELRMRRRGGGIIRFELAGTPAKTDRIMQEWGDIGCAAAATSLRLDYPYLTTYGLLLHRLCESTGCRLDDGGLGRFGRLGRPVARAQIAAAAFDAVENAALLAVLAGRRGRYPKIARANALAKFALLTLGGLYVAAGRGVLACHARR